MAVTHRFYRSNRIGSGTKLDPFRAALSRYTQEFETWDLPPVEMATARYCFSHCESAIHAQAVLDADVLALSPELADIAAVNNWLDGQLGTVSRAIRDAIEGDRIPVDDLTSANTRRQLLRRIALYHRVAQFLRGEFRQFSTLLGPYAFTRGIGGVKVANAMSVVPNSVLALASAYADQRRIDVSWVTPATLITDVIQACMRDRRAELLTFIRRNLDETVADVPSGARTRIQNWMQDQTLDTTWITGATTIRTVLKFIAANLGLQPLAFQQVSF